MTTYKLNTEAAKSADAPRNNRITETGAYKGVFTLAKRIVANSGTEGMEFTFQAEDGAVANWLRLYTQKADGTETFGMGMLMAAMTCLKVREITSTVITIEEWDRNANAKVPVEVENFDSLCNKPIGILIQKELKDGTLSDGSPKFSLQIAGFFEAATGLTATDILEKRPAGSLETKLKYLKDKDSRTAGGYDGGFSEPVSKTAHVSSSGAGFDDLESDIPFSPISRKLCLMV